VRRLAALALLVVAAAGAALLSLGAGGDSGGGTYRVDAIFDNAGFLIPGQDVKIAGARVGEVVGVELTPQRRARIEMAVEERFGPWRDDADCTIQPQSLIGEKFVQCTPGTPRGKPLRGEPDTLPVENTHAPIDPDLVFAALRAPVPDRLGIVIAELGGGLAGRSEDLSATIRRANPALEHTRRVLAILDEDRAKLRSLTGEAERVIGALAGERGAVTSAISRGARVTQATARRRRELGQTIDRLPGTLAATRPALARLRELARDGTPVLGDLRRAAPALSQLAADAGPLADAAGPALDRLGRAARTGEPILRRAAPLVGDLRTFAREAKPTGALVAELFTSLRERGVVEGLQDFTYYAAQATARFDEFSHIIPAHLLGSECSQYATVTVPDCEANFRGGGRTARARARRADDRDDGDRGRRGRDGGDRGGDEPRGDGGRETPRGSGSDDGAGKPRDGLLPGLPQLDDLPKPEVPKVPEPDVPPAEDLLDFLLGSGAR
jgi:phospholipid/cholesterol/gamma-HCH transport system substrate-binding protein